MTDEEKRRATRELAKQVVRDGVIEDAAAQVISQIIEFIHKERIEPLNQKIRDLQAEVDRLEAQVDELKFYGS